MPPSRLSLIEVPSKDWNSSSLLCLSLSVIYSSSSPRSTPGSSVMKLGSYSSSELSLSTSYFSWLHFPLKSCYISVFLRLS